MAARVIIGILILCIILCIWLIVDYVRIQNVLKEIWSSKEGEMKRRLFIERESLKKELHKKYPSTTTIFEETSKSLQLEKEKVKRLEEKLK